MKVVVDSNVIAYTLLGTAEVAEQCVTFWRRADDRLAPAFWEAEIANVLWKSVRAGVIELAAALDRLQLSLKLGVRSFPASSLWEGALTRAVNTGVSAYDTLFVELAVRESAPLVTFDTALLKSFPEVACLPSSLERRRGIA